MISRIIAVLACLALLPVLYSPTLRFFYQQWIAVQLAKVRHPNLVVIGDSIAAGGAGYGRIDTINLASNGLEAHQIARAIARAKLYRPTRILADGGVNDVVEGHLDPVELRKAWRTMCAEPNVIAALPTPTRSQKLNSQLATVRAIIVSECRHTVDAPELAGPDGLLKPEYSLDGVHLTERAYRFWVAALR